ncbi:conserved hypothetical protein [Histoplasma capsulatum var. duboisii H88]|uniref:Uncharacterized protein n=1 Tax=Ajellomyces capsulatus (strain H88) TaxID=544711 RepID=F0UV72_AJEC8|nr:conserved hypothetical protein [Histoplasma capsulatum var. duboisii H88]
MKRNDDGFFHLDNTGILRSFNRDNKVIDYQKLSKEDFNTLSKVYLNKEAKDSLKHWSESSSLIDDNEIWNPFHDRIPSFQLPELEANKESMELQSRKLNILSPYRDLCTPLNCRWSTDCRYFHQLPYVKSSIIPFSSELILFGAIKVLTEGRLDSDGASFYEELDQLGDVICSGNLTQGLASPRP